MEALAAELYSIEVTDSADPENPCEYGPALHIAKKFIERQRRPRDYRVMTDDFLKKVAEVYRENIHSAPTRPWPSTSVSRTGWHRPTSIGHARHGSCRRPSRARRGREPMSRQQLPPQIKKVDVTDRKTRKRGVRY